MTKKKAKSKASKKTAKKKSSSKKKKELNPVEVRKEIAGMVELEATDMAQAVIDEGLKGQLATVKYLFEVAKIYPPATDGSESSSEEDSLAKTLLHRLNLPEEPIKHEDDDEPVMVGAGAASAAKSEACDAGAVAAVVAGGIEKASTTGDTEVH